MQGLRKAGEREAYEREYLEGAGLSCVRKGVCVRKNGEILFASLQEKGGEGQTQAEHMKDTWWEKAVAVHDVSRVVWVRRQGKGWEVCDYETGECRVMDAARFSALYVPRAWCPAHVRAWLDGLPCFDRWTPKVAEKGKCNALV